MKVFKTGDKVYCPSAGTDIYTVQVLKDDILSLSFNKQHIPFDKNGISTITKMAIVFSVTPENHALLEQLYGVEFEKAPIKPASRDIIQAMLARGDLGVPCWVSNDIQNPNHCKQVLISGYEEGEEFSYWSDNECWKYATPFNLETGEAITELPT